MKSKDEINTLIGAGTVVAGDINVSSSSRIDGTVRGKVKSKGTLMLGNQGKIFGDISSEEVIIGGKVEGNIYARKNLVLEAKSFLKGDIYTKNIKIIEGAKFNGSCKMLQ